MLSKQEYGNHIEPQRRSKRKKDGNTNKLSCRIKELEREAIDITPTDGKFIWSKTNDLENFEKNWQLKPVVINGHLATNEEVRVNKIRDNERGYDIIAPLYTHLNDMGEPCGILVNRGFLTNAFISNTNYTNIRQGPIYGLLYKGET